MKRLVVIETHPIQYHAPLYRLLQQKHNIAVTAIYGSDFSVAGYYDAEFGATFKWDTDLLSGYDARFLATVARGGGQDVARVSTRGLSAMLRELQSDAILLVGYSPRFHQAAFFSSWRYGAPLLFRGETNDRALVRRSAKQFARAQMLRMFYARFRALLYVGENSRSHFAALGISASKLFFSPYGVDTTPFCLDESLRLELRAATRDALSIAGNRIVILFSGKLSARKAPDVLVQACKQLPETIRDNLTVLWLGDGELRAELERVGQIAPRVDMRFVGFQNQRALSRFYHASDVLVLPSRAGETWGLVVNEALHHGVPCVVSDRVGCAPDLIETGKTGELFCADDSSDLARALRAGFDLMGRAEIRAMCRERAGQYTLERAAQGIADAFGQVTR